MHGSAHLVFQCCIQIFKLVFFGKCKSMTSLVKSFKLEFLRLHCAWVVTFTDLSQCKNARVILAFINTIGCVDMCSIIYCVQDFDRVQLSSGEAINSYD